MKDCDLSITLINCVKDNIDSFGKPKEVKLDFFVLTLSNKASFNSIRKALADAKGEEYSKNDGRTSVFVFFKPLDRKNADESKIPGSIKTVFRRTHEFGIPDDDDIVEFTVTENKYKYWCVKLNFK